MGTIIGLVLLALAVLVTVITVAVKAIVKAAGGDIPVPRSSEQTIEERILAESQEEADVTARRVELQRERQRLVEERRQFHTQIRAQDATGVTDRRGADLIAATQRVTPAVQSLAQSIRDMGAAFIGEEPQRFVDGRQGLEIRIEQRTEQMRGSTVTGPTGGSPGQSGKPSQKADTSAPVKRKSRYERDPVI